MASADGKVIAVPGLTRPDRGIKDIVENVAFSRYRSTPHKVTYPASVTLNQKPEARTRTIIPGTNASQLGPHGVYRPAVPGITNP